MIKKEVIIVGAGPAGAACARRLKNHRIDFLILDRSDFPRSKPCAGWVTPGVFDLLELTPGEYPFSLTHFQSFKISLRGIKFRLPTHQFAIRRIEFDAWLLDSAGIKPHRHSVQKITQFNKGYRIDGEYEAKYLVGAGGTNCPVRRTLFKNQMTDTESGLIVAKEEEFPYAYSDDRCYLWFFEKGLPGYAWYVPKKGSILNVGIGASAAGLKAKRESLNQHWQELIHKLKRLGLVNGHAFKPNGHSYYLRQKAPRLQHQNAFLVGDALGLATRDMGEGIVPAIQSGYLAADAIICKQAYSIKTIHRFSLPSLLRLRK